MKSIAAISTPPGIGGIAVIRLSGDDAFLIADKIWKGTPLSQLPSHTARLGIITDSDGEMLDQAVATIYAEGKSFTGEPTVEFSVHGSKWIQKRVLERLIEEGASAAGPGEFTKRAFLNGRLDLAQSEAVADMIAASSKASQRLAAAQMKGTFSQRLNDLRDRMIQLASLLELELDFSEEDVEFADRSQLLRLTESTHEEISRLAASFRTGRALKEGVAVVIAGAPNAGKSTLLNHLLQDEKAIISDIPGTTRDIIEDTAEINGILFRFIDTAGIRHTTDRIEQIGVDRARNVLTKADIILHLIDSTPNPTSPTLSADDLSADILTSLPADTPVIKVYTKSDLQQESATKTDTKSSPELQNESSPEPQNDSSIEPQTESSPELQKAAHPNIETVSISVKTGKGIPQLIDLLTAYATGGADRTHDLIVTNARHYESLTRAADALLRVSDALTAQLPADLIAQDLREAIHHLAAITGAITPADLLQSIFTRFCIGK